MQRLSDAFVHLGEAGAATAYPVGPDFWSNMPAAFEAGRMVSVMAQEHSWESAEMHPDGEELILMLSGRLRIITGSGNTDLASGDYVLVPRGEWHTADVIEPGTALFITPGARTQSRPR